ncbi:AraC family transcriptional regulator [Nocardia rhizosphaerae]|uniref:AraC family transcriptional regulator n=1 Tax=Nocardia rhizosphaerae TaxID=1691571 RepID=A0ABV8L692_9NOCA
MSYTIVVRPGALYGGLAVPRVHPSFKVSNSDLIDFLKDRLRDRPGGAEPLRTVYVPDSAGNWNALVAREFAAPEEVPVGDLMVYVPKGAYARFVPNGDYHDPAEDVWAQVDDATASAEISRAYREEVEVWHGPDTVELFVSITVDS